MRTRHRTRRDSRQATGLLSPITARIWHELQVGSIYFSGASIPAGVRTEHRGGSVGGLLANGAAYFRPQRSAAVARTRVDASAEMVAFGMKF
jgi:hypothetical protein